MMPQQQSKQEARLKEWRQVGRRLTGIVSNHPKFRDGEIVTTSEVIRFNESRTAAETKNTFYLLEDEFDANAAS